MLSRNGSIWSIIIVIFVIAWSVTPALSKDTQFGLRLGIYSDAGDAFIGADVNTPISSHVNFNPNIEYVLIDHGTYLTVNGDFHYDFDVRRPIYLWAGGGPALIFFNPEGPDNSDNNLGINLLAGIGFKTSGSLIPYFQTKAILSDNDEISFAFGVRF